MKSVAVEIGEPEARLLVRLAGAHGIAETLHMLVSESKNGVSEDLRMRLQRCINDRPNDFSEKMMEKDPEGAPNVNETISHPSLQAISIEKTGSHIQPTIQSRSLRDHHGFPTRFLTFDQEMEIKRASGLANMFCVEASFDGKILEGRDLSPILDEILTISFESLGSIAAVERVSGLRALASVRSGKSSKHRMIGVYFRLPDNFSACRSISSLASRLGVPVSLVWKKSGRAVFTFQNKNAPEEQRSPFNTPVRSEAIAQREPEKTVKIGSLLTVSRIGSSTEEIFEILPTTEPNDAAGRRINAGQPFAQAALDCKVGQIFSVTIGRDVQKFLVKEIA